MFIYVLICIFFPFSFFCGLLSEPFLKSLICYNVVSVLSFGSFFGLEACEISAPQPRFELPPPAVEGRVLTAGLPRKPLYVFSKESSLWNHLLNYTFRSIVSWWYLSAGLHLLITVCLINVIRSVTSLRILKSPSGHCFFSLHLAWLCLWSTDAAGCFS